MILNPVETGFRNEEIWRSIWEMVSESRSVWTQADWLLRGLSGVYVQTRYSKLSGTNNNINNIENLQNYSI